MKINQYKQFVIQKNKIEYLEKLEYFNESLINEEVSVRLGFKGKGTDKKKLWKN